MLYTTIAIFVMLVFLDRALRLEQKNFLKMETQFNLFALRDELRRGETNQDSEFLDKMITVTAKGLLELSILQMITYYFVMGVSDKSKKDLKREISSIQSDPQLADIYKRFNNELLVYLSKRHRWFIKAFVASLFGGISLLVFFMFIKRFHISLPNKHQNLIDNVL